MISCGNRCRCLPSFITFENRNDDDGGDVDADDDGDDDGDNVGDVDGDGDDDDDINCV